MNKNNYSYWKKLLAFVTVLVVLFGIGTSMQMAQAASQKSIKTVTIKIGSKKVNGTTVSMKKGKTAKIKVSTSPKLVEKTIAYKSSKPSIVSVNKNGTLTAKKAGTSTIRVTVKAEGYQSKKVTFQVKVTKANTPANSTTENTETNGEVSDSNSTTAKKILVAYFSCTNTTKGVAETIAEAAGAELYEIQPSKPYTTADLNYNNDSCRANEEQNASARPAIKNNIENFNDYEIIYLGFPIWLAYHNLIQCTQA